MHHLTEAIQSLPRLFDAIPKGKFRTIMNEAQIVEIGMRQSAAVLHMLRDYFIETTGEESPFVKKIDELLPRKEKT